MSTRCVHCSLPVIQLSEEPSCIFGNYRFVLNAEHYPSGVYSLCESCPIIEYQVYAAEGGYDYFWYQLTEENHHQLVDMLKNMGLTHHMHPKVHMEPKRMPKKAERNAEKQ